MRNKLKAIILSGLLVLTLTSCGYDGHFRYPCQDPDNWETKECKPPVCKVTGTCPDAIIGVDPSEWTTTDEDTISPNIETSGELNE
jgi:predicted small lipoprotein YifL